MRDEELRRLERQSQERGDSPSEARHLLERVRRGDLPQERLELAAHVGHEAARLALAGRFTEPPEGLADWLQALARFGRETQLRVAITLARLYARTNRYGRWHEDDGARLSLEAAEAYFLERSEAKKAALDRALASEGGRAGGIVASLMAFEDSFNDNFTELTRVMESQTSYHGSLRVRTVRDSVREDLVSWALGELDPVATRGDREGTRFSSEDGEIIRALAFDPAGSRVLIANRIGQVRIRAFPSGKLLLELPKVSREVFVVAWTPDGTRVVTGDNVGQVRTFAADSGVELTSWRFGAEVAREAIYGLALLEGGAHVALGAVAATASSAKAAIVELATGKVVLQLMDHPRSVTALDSFPPSGDAGPWIATASGDETVRVFDSRNGTLVRAFEQVSANDLAFLPDGRLVTGEDAGVVRLLDVKSGASDVLQTVGVDDTKGSTVYAVATASTGVFAGAPSDRAPIYVWDAQSGAVLRRYAWDLSIPLALAFSPDGQHLLMGDRGGGVRLYCV